MSDLYHNGKLVLGGLTPESADYIVRLGQETGRTYEVRPRSERNDREWSRLTPVQEIAVLNCISAARIRDGRHTEEIEGEGEAYAYRLDACRIAWGWNAAPSGFNTARGTVPREAGQETAPTAPVPSNSKETAKITSKAKTSKAEDEALVILRHQRQRASLGARPFVDAVIERAEKMGLPTLAKKNRTLPKLLAHFRAYASVEALDEAIKPVVAKYSRVH